MKKLSNTPKDELPKKFLTVITAENQKELSKIADLSALYIEGCAAGAFPHPRHPQAYAIFRPTPRDASQMGEFHGLAVDFPGNQGEPLWVDASARTLEQAEFALNRLLKLLGVMMSYKEWRDSRKLKAES